MVDEKVADERLQKLQKLLLNQQKEYNASFVGKKMEILFESRSPKATSNFNQITGKSPYLQAVSVILPPEEDASNYFGKIVEVEITEAKENTLVGVLSSNSSN